MNRNLIPVQNKTLTTASVSFIPFRGMKDKKGCIPAIPGIHPFLIFFFPLLFTGRYTSE